MEEAGHILARTIHESRVRMVRGAMSRFAQVGPLTAVSASRIRELRPSGVFLDHRYESISVLDKLERSRIVIFVGIAVATQSKC